MAQHDRKIRKVICHFRRIFRTLMKAGIATRHLSGAVEQDVQCPRDPAAIICHKSWTRSSWKSNRCNEVFRKCAKMSIVWSKFSGYRDFAHYGFHISLEVLVVQFLTGRDFKMGQLARSRNKRSAAQGIRSSFAKAMSRRILVLLESYG